MTRTALTIVALLLSILYCSSLDVSGHLRRLIGSNCVLIERGTVPPYYDCVGCEIERAAACIDDMRFNRSYNVASDCRMASVKQFNDEVCCPRFLKNKYNNADLNYIGSAYPEALRCMQRVGCQKSILYSQLQAECETTCRKRDPRNGGNVCFSNFNSASRIQLSLGWTICAVVVVAMCTWSL
jgi:hypothetical protein